MKKTQTLSIGLLVAVLASLGYSSRAFSNASCSGTVGSVRVDSSGNLLINPSWRGGYTKLCIMSGDATAIATARLGWL